MAPANPNNRITLTKLCSHLNVDAAIRQDGTEATTDKFNSKDVKYSRSINQLCAGAASRDFALREKTARSRRRQATLLRCHPVAVRTSRTRRCRRGYRRRGDR
jgi:hypothetical protein